MLSKILLAEEPFTQDELKLIHDSLQSRSRHLSKRISESAKLGLTAAHAETDQTIQQLQALIEKLEPMIRI